MEDFASKKKTYIDDIDVILISIQQAFLLILSFVCLSRMYNHCISWNKICLNQVPTHATYDFV